MKSLLLVVISLLSGLSAWSQECDPFIQQPLTPYFGVPLGRTRGEQSGARPDRQVSLLPSLDRETITIRVFDRDCRLIGGLYRLTAPDAPRADFDVFISALHVVEGLSTATLEAGFLASGLLLSDYQAFELTADGRRRLDVVIFVKKRIAGELQLPSLVRDLVRRKGLNDLVASGTEIGDPWLSVQLNRSEMGSFTIESRGRIVNKGPDRLWLSATQADHTSAGNSGSLLYRMPKEALSRHGRVSPLAWKTAGVITCIDRTHGSGGRVGAIPWSVIGGATMYPVDFDELARRPEPTALPDGCEPIDRRSGGY